MTKALAVILFQGPPIRHEWYRLTFELLKISLLKCTDQFDKIYLVDNSANFTDEDREFLLNFFPKKVVIMLGRMDSHWDMMNMITKQVTEDALLLIDSDTMIYNPNSVADGFKKLNEGFDVASIFDSSGADLGFEVLEEARRFAPYMCFMYTDVLQQTSMNFNPDAEHDSMGLLTKELLKNGVHAKRLPDDRGTAYIDGTVYSPILPEPGYYHMRNSNGALHILTSWVNDRPSYDRDVKLMPLNERCRLLAWMKIANNLTWGDPIVDNTIKDIFLDWGITPTQMEEYLYHFKDFHAWLKDF